MLAKSYVVGIGGGTAAGKSSLARALKQFLEEREAALRVEMLSADAFYRADKTLGPMFVSPSWGEEHFNFNHPDAIEQERLLAAIAERSSAQDAPQVLLVEGLMVLHLPKIRETLDLRVFVELEADVRAVRRVLRDMKGERGNTDPEWIGTYYLECARVGHELFVEPSRVHADFIVRGDANLSRLVPRLGKSIQGCCGLDNDEK